jgi:nucleotide-binding universal stress UspA family protein
VPEETESDECRRAAPKLATGAMLRSKLDARLQVQASWSAAGARAVANCPVRARGDERAARAQVVSREVLVMETPEPPVRLSLVVSVNFTESSDYALELGKNLVRPYGAGAELHVVHVTSPLYWPVGVAPVLAANDHSAAEVTRQGLLEMCSAVGGSVEARTVPHVRLGDAPHEIAAVAREVHADLIVVGAHKRMGLSSALHRSLLASLVRRAPCSVLTAIRKETEAEAAIEPPCEACLVARQESQGTVLWCVQHGAHHVHGHLHHGGSGSLFDGSWTFRT